MTGPGSRSADQWETANGKRAVQANGSADSTRDTDFNSATLKRAIEKHVVPEVTQADDSELVAGVLPADVLRALTSQNAGFLRTIVPALLEQHVSFSRFHDAVLMPVLTLLGEKWSRDELDFLTVDLATTRMQLVAEEFIRENIRRRGGSENVGKSVLLAHVDDEKHTLGMTMVRAFFLDAGWMVSGGTHVTPANGLYDALRSEHFDLLAMSSGHEKAGYVHDVLQKARTRARNDKIVICVGGPSVADDETRFSNVGAEIIAYDPRDAVAEANVMVASVA